MDFTKEQIDKLLEDYVPESKTESLINRHRDEVEVTFYWNHYTSKWDNKESAKKGWLLVKFEEQVNKLLPR
jgi:hypothetical protein